MKQRKWQPIFWYVHWFPYPPTPQFLNSKYPQTHCITTATLVFLLKRVFGEFTVLFPYGRQKSSFILIDTNNCGGGGGGLMTMEFQGHGGITQGKGEGKIRKPSTVWYGYSRNRPIWVYPWRMSRMFNPEDSKCFFTLTIKKTSTLYKLPVMKNSISSDGTGGRGLGVGIDPFLFCRHFHMPRLCWFLLSRRNKAHTFTRSVSRYLCIHDHSLLHSFIHSFIHASFCPELWTMYVMAWPHAWHA